MNLTRRQKEIFDFIQNYLFRHDIAPTVNEIRDHFKLKSLATVHKHLKALESRGWIKRDRQKARAIELLNIDVQRNFDIPLLGLIAAGQPILALENPDTLSIPEDMIGRKETFALKVTGNSMIEDGIHDGDFIIVESRDVFQNGEIVVALIKQDESTVKRIYQEKSMIRLQPSNAEMNPIILPAKDVQVRGVVIGLIRKYQRF